MFATSVWNYVPMKSILSLFIQGDEQACRWNENMPEHLCITLEKRRLLRVNMTPCFPVPGREQTNYIDRIVQIAFHDIDIRAFS